ncbi:MAG: hypothetical protein Tsb009_27030 [Planctomycetaceae bacterium]
MGTWEPQTIRRFVIGFPTSARTAYVETDIGPGYLKAMGGPEGPHTLASEVVATQLASWCGLKTLDWAIVTVDEFDEIPFFDKEKNQDGCASAGPAFITRAESGMTWGGSDRELKLLVNPDDISRLVVFDTWVLNCDRYSNSRNSSINRTRIKRDNVFLSQEATEGKFLLKAIDHTHCFTCGREWTRRLRHDDTMKDSRLFGLFPEFKNFLNRRVIMEMTEHLRTVTAQDVRTMTQSVPKEWEVSREALDALVELVVGRARFVADTIEKRIWPQNELFGNDQ